MPFWLKLCPGFFEPNLCEKNEFGHLRTNPDQAMPSSATSATSFELIEDQTLTVEEVEMASQEAQEIRTRKAAVAAGLVLDEPEAPPSALATDVMKDLCSVLEAFATPTSGLGAPGPAEEEDKDMEDHGAGHSTGGGTDTTHEEAEGFRGGFPEDRGSCEQTGLLGAG